jgi:LytS/YehU family sensor histidine kinase
MVLENSNKKLVTLSAELELLKHYLELEQLRVHFNYDISLDENIDPETEELPGMLVQPFVENAVIHGITPKGKGNITVKFSKDNEILRCEIIDDGMGINTKGPGDGNGLAMKLSEKRLNLLNSQLKTKLCLTVENRMETEKTDGTKITLLIPVG